MYEQQDILLPPPDELVLPHTPPPSLARHLLALTDIGEHCWLNGEFTPTSSGTVAGAQLLGHLRWDEGAELRRGSLVTLSGSSSIWRPSGG